MLWACLAAVLAGPAPAGLMALKPWEPNASYSEKDRTEFEVHFQPVAERFVLDGVEKYDRWTMEPKLLLGDLLFHAPKLLGPRSGVFGVTCNTCHPGGAAKNDFFAEGAGDRPGNVDLLSDYFYAEADDGVFAPRNIPSLRGAAQTAPYRRDGAVATLEATNALVVGHEFQQKVPPSWLEALTAFVTRLSFPSNAQVDAAGALTDKAPELARAGEKVFELRGCANCHVKTTRFTDQQTHPLRHGEGKGTLGKTQSFDTPTLLGTAETAPYFFDGSARTYADAVALIARREKLQLPKRDAAALAAYLAAVGAVDEPAAPASADERVRQALGWSRLGKDADDALWPLLIDAIRLEVRLALRASTPAQAKRYEPLQRELEGLLREPVSAARRQQLEKLGSAGL